MTIDLWMLVFTAVFCALIPNFGIVGLLSMPGGPDWGFGNRDTDFAVPDWISRTRRAHANMVENLGPFAVLVLVAHVAGKSDATTALASQIFFVARVAYTGVYMVGIPYVRTGVFAISIVAEVMILIQLLN